MYVPLHMHYHKGSVGDSILKVKDAVKKAKDSGIIALSITDHGSMANVIEFYKECISHNIKPLVGLEAYECKDRTSKEKGYYHLVLLAKNKQGYKDLLHIATDSEEKGFYYKPRTDMSVLKEYGSNLIGLSACLGGKIPRLIKELLKISKDGSTAIKDSIDETNNLLSSMGIDYINIDDKELFNLCLEAQKKEIIKAIQEYKECFDDFYLELQPGNFKEQIITNKILVSLAKETNTKLVITNDVHYLNKQDYKAHDYHVKMKQKKKYNDEMVYPDTCYYLMNYNEIKTMFPYLEENVVEEAIKNTVRISDKIDLANLYDGKIKMPKADIPSEFTEDEYLEKIVYEKLYEIRHRVKDPSEYLDRVEMELETLKVVGFSGYMLIIKDIFDYANKKKIPMGPGRGSIGGSLVAYLLGITKVDSIKYKLLFERFISIFRKGSVPDIDLDVASNRRKELFDYVINKYGYEFCALVSSFTIRKARSAIKDTAKIFNIDNSFAEMTSKLIPQVYYSDVDGEKKTDISIEEALDISPKLREIKSNNEEWFSAAISLENSTKTTSIHPAGTLISPIPLRDYIPLIRSDNESGMMATGLDLEGAEYAGAIKYDFLSLATLNITSETEKDTGFIPDFDDDNWLNDKNVWKNIASKHTTTLFQISSKTYQSRMRRINPQSIEELAAALALVRGPCISSKLDEQYMQIAEGKRDVELIHPFYDSVTSETKGILIYQEQMMQILINFGMSTERAFQIMKYASKKKQAQLEAAEIEYKALAYKNNVPDLAANKIWKIMLDTGKYSFNKSHAIAYALLCYYSAFLKTYYPLAWMKNALSNAYERKEHIEETIQECRRLGIEFLCLDINKSKWNFTIEDNKLRIGFVAVKGLGLIAYNALEKARPILNIDNAINNLSGDFNKTAFVLSVFAGAFSCFNTDKVATYKYYCNNKKIKISDSIRISNEASFKIMDSDQDIEAAIYEIPIISNPAKNFKPFFIDNIKNGQACELQAIVRNIKEIKDKNKNSMAFLTIETYSGQVECVVFSNVYKNSQNLIKKNATLLLRAKKDKESLILNSIVA